MRQRALGWSCHYTKCGGPVTKWWVAPAAWPDTEVWRLAQLVPARARDAGVC